MNAKEIIEKLEGYKSLQVSFKQWHNSDNMAVMLDDGANTITFELEQVYSGGCMYFIKADILNREDGRYTHQSYEKVQKRVFDKVKEYLLSAYFPA